MLPFERLAQKITALWPHTKTTCSAHKLEFEIWIYLLPFKASSLLIRQRSYLRSILIRLPYLDSAVLCLFINYSNWPIFVILSAAKDLNVAGVIATHRSIMLLRRLDSSRHCVSLRMTLQAKYLHKKSLWTSLHSTRSVWVNYNKDYRHITRRKAIIPQIETDTGSCFTNLSIY